MTRSGFEVFTGTMSAERKLQQATTTPDSSDQLPLEPFALKQQVAERLAAHRSRKVRPVGTAVEQPAPATPARERASRIAAAVAERYAHSKSYRSFLAEEAERAIQQAEAAAEVAALNAQAVAQAQYELLETLDQYAAEPQPAPMLVPAPPAPKAETPELHAAPEPKFDASSLTVRLGNDIRLPDSEAALRALRTAHEELDAETIDPEEALSLDEEIAFRQAPIFEVLEPTVEIPANLIEFPRQLVAARKARPRLAEGPLREEDDAQHDTTQLRIFEVEPEQLSPAPAVDAVAPEWTSILLDAQPRGEAVAHTETDEYAGYARQARVTSAAQQQEAQRHYAASFQVAPMNLRIMAAAVDGCAIVAAFLVFIAALVLTASQFAPNGLHINLQTAALSSVGALVVLGFAYQYLFFTFSDATPGMRYARIGLCTFSDENPTRAAMRRRAFALVLSAAPLGLGLIWTLFDSDGLGWHDHISRMYQRSY